MKTGITALVLPSEWGLAETLENVRADGYEALELALRDSGYCALGVADAQLRSIREKAEQANVELVGLCPAFRGRPRDLMTADREARNAGIETFEECIRMATVLDVDTILVVLGSLTPDLYYDVAYRNALESMRTLAPMAEKAGVRLAIEYVWNKFLLSPLEFARFCDEVGSPNVGFYFDPGNMAIFGYPQHWVRICARHVMAVHMKDFRRKGYEWTPLLEGDVDFPMVMRELRSLGYDGALVAEVDSSIAPFPKTAEAVKQIMKM
jgi:hexulose-6-phosphate isomerase